MIAANAETQDASRSLSPVEVVSDLARAREQLGE